MQAPSHEARLVELDETLAQIVAGWVVSPADVAMFAGDSLPWPLMASDLLAAARRRDAVVLLVDGQPCAFGSLRLQGDQARVGWVLVDPGRRGEGWGRAIATALLARARALPGLRRVTLGVYAHNHAARRLYGDLGFTETGERGSRVVGEETWTSLELELRLRP